MASDTAFVLMVALVGLLIGLSKGGMGAAIVVAVTPLLSMVMPVADAISLALPLLLIADVVAIALYWNTWDWAYVRQMLPPAVIGIVVGTLLLVVLPDLTLRRVMGILVLSFVVYRLISSRLNTLAYRPQPWHGAVVGGASGLGSALANSGAPPFMAYMLLQPISPPVFVGTTTLFFALVNAIKLPGLLLTDLLHIEDLMQTLWVIPIILGGVFLGRWMVRRINQHWFDRLMLAVLTAAALILLLVNPA